MNSSAPVQSPRLPRPKSSLRWVTSAALFAALVLLYEMTGESGYVGRREQQQRIQALSQQVEDLQRENQRLSENIQSLRSDPAAIEELARERLHLARPGEVVVTLPSPPSR